MTPHEDRQNASATPEEPRLSAWDQGIVGRAIRIEIPFSDLYKMREIAAMLRGLANEFRIWLVLYHV